MVRLKFSSLLVFVDRNKIFLNILLLVNLCSDPEDKLKIYKDNFEKAYLESTNEFYSQHAQDYISKNGIINYLTYADMKLKEEERRGNKYLETCKGSDSIQLVRERKKKFQLLSFFFFFS